MRCGRALPEISRLGRKEELAVNPRLANHLRLCPKCQKEWERHAALLDVLASTAPVPAFNDILPRVMMRLDESQTSSAKSWQWAAAAAIALAALLFGYLLGLRSASIPGSTEGPAAAYKEALSGMPSGSVELAALEPYTSGAETVTAETSR